MTSQNPTGIAVGTLFYDRVLSIHLKSCSNLRNKDGDDGGDDVSDPYAIIKNNGTSLPNKMKSAVHKNNLDPVFDEHFNMLLAPDVTAWELVLKDKDFASDDRLCKLDFPLDDVVPYTLQGGEELDMGWGSTVNVSWVLQTLSTSVISAATQLSELGATNADLAEQVAALSEENAELTMINDTMVMENEARIQEIKEEAAAEDEADEEAKAELAAKLEALKMQMESDQKEFEAAIAEQQAEKEAAVAAAEEAEAAAAEERAALAEEAAELEAQLEEARDGVENEVRTVEEHSGDAIEVPEGPGAVVRAFYGDPEALFDEERGADVTEIVVARLMEGESLEADNGVFGDPIGGIVKMLAVEIAAENPAAAMVEMKQKMNRMGQRISSLQSKMMNKDMQILDLQSEVGSKDERIKTLKKRVRRLKNKIEGLEEELDDEE